MNDSRDQLLLTGHSLVSFSSGMSGQEADDILDCLNYSETRASRKFDRQHTWSSWINRYQASLYQNGFKLSGAVGDMFFITEPRELLVTASDAIQTSGHPELAALASAALDRLLRSHQGQTFFKGWFSASRSESFQVVPCRQVASGGIEVLVCGVQMQADSFEGSWFTRPISGMTVRINGGAYLYSAESYEPFREKVTDKLERYSRIYFENLP